MAELLFQSITDKKKRLKELIQNDALIFKKITLASGGESHYFFDMKMVSMQAEGSSLIAELILDILKNEEVDYIGGLESGAIPIVASLCTKSWEHNTPIDGFFVRKTPKNRGTRKKIEGKLEDGSRVILLDDVTTKGGSVLNAVEEVRQNDCIVEKVITVVDRKAGAKENLQKANIELIPLFTYDDFAEEIERNAE